MEWMTIPTVFQISGDEPLAIRVSRRYRREDYTLTATVRVLDPAPLKGFRPGEGMVFKGGVDQ
jgi:hypothetical protein